MSSLQITNWEKRRHLAQNQAFSPRIRTFPIAVLTILLGLGLVVDNTSFAERVRKSGPSGKKDAPKSGSGKAVATETKINKFFKLQDQKRSKGTSVPIKILDTNNPTLKSSQSGHAPKKGSAKKPALDVVAKADAPTLRRSRITDAEPLSSWKQRPKPTSEQQKPFKAMLENITKNEKLTPKQKQDMALVVKENQEIVNRLHAMLKAENAKEGSKNSEMMNQIKGWIDKITRDLGTLFDSVGKNAPGAPAKALALAKSTKQLKSELGKTFKQKELKAMFPKRKDRNAAMRDYMAAKLILQLVNAKSPEAQAFSKDFVGSMGNLFSHVTKTLDSMKSSVADTNYILFTNRLVSKLMKEGLPSAKESFDGYILRLAKEMGITKAEDIKKLEAALCQCLKGPGASCKLKAA